MTTSPTDQTLKYEYALDADNENMAGAKVARFVGRQKRVLEIGCGPGAITRILHGKNGCQVTGIEVDEEASRRVAAFCDEVLQLDLNEPGWVDAVKSRGPFEVVVAADVLEHLADPWWVLSQLKGFLAPGGYVVVSLPHAGHNAVIASLLDGDLEYGRTGLLDKTHVRFFGLKNVQALFEEAGFTITEASFVARHATETELAHHWAALPSATRRALDRNPYGAVYQVVAKAVPSSAATAGVNLLELPLPVRREPARVLAFVHRQLKSWLPSSAMARLKQLSGSNRRP
jgi:2-polyprenyl-3-methyl-5-hydroxy-6-metoxy-1,4-benzoquinol methylase